MNSTVASPPSRPRRRRAASITARTSLTPADSADNASKRRPVTCDTSRASVVFPVPGGPYRITDAAAPPSTNLRSGLPGASKWSCPTTSSSVIGRIRTASGAEADSRCSASCSACAANSPSLNSASSPSNPSPDTPRRYRRGPTDQIPQHQPGVSFSPAPAGGAGYGHHAGCAASVPAPRRA